MTRTRGEHGVHGAFSLVLRVSARLPGTSPHVGFSCDTEDVSELSMLKILDHAVKEHGLSYTECCFEQLDGVKIDSEAK